MTIDISCVSYVSEDELPSSACAILLKTNSNGKMVKRKMTFHLGGSTEFVAAVQMVRLALSAVQPECRSGSVYLHTNYDETMSLLSKVGGEYEKQYDDPCVEKLRVVADTFGSLFVDRLTEADEKELLNMAETCANDFRACDSGIVHE